MVNGERFDPERAGDVTPVPILLVDDHPRNLLSLQAVLQHGPNELVVAHSGAEAVRACAEREFAAVLLDVQMPEMDGFETASRMRQVWHGDYRVPVIFVTGMAGAPASVRQAYEGGAVDFLQKPLEPAAIWSAECSIHKRWSTGCVPPLTGP